MIVEILVETGLKPVGGTTQPGELAKPCIDQNGLNLFYTFLGDLKDTKATLFTLV